MTQNFEISVDSSLLNEHLWQERLGLTKTRLISIIETLLFVTDKPLSLEQIQAYIDPEEKSLPLSILQEAIENLQFFFNQSEERGIRLVEVAQGFQFRTRALNAQYVSDVHRLDKVVLTPAAQEVLAIIAYKWPISKTEIDVIRGVDSSHLIRTLLDRRLIHAVGRSEELLGRPTQYATTKEFLEIFGLNSLEDLPQEHLLQEEIETQKQKYTMSNSDIFEQKNLFNFDDLEEIDKLQEQLKSSSQQAPFIKALTDLENTKEQNGPRTSLFGLLEEYLLKEQIAQQNTAASLSLPILESEQNNIKIISFAEEENR